MHSIVKPSMSSTEVNGVGGEKREEKYVRFPCVDDDATREGKPVLNKYSHFITKDHDFPGAQVRIYCHSHDSPCRSRERGGIHGTKQS